ncbi:hypothetical protein [Actinacidiphila yeochonensis]|uniref:hypothetical protein n=1 Tax=Actinacidiphila yeochonensis TaxID=89050 RepID=UPI000564F167|nr:hypothetical protein [Actinacidiphila yeochonensis]
MADVYLDLNGGQNDVEDLSRVHTSMNNALDIMKSTIQQALANLSGDTATAFAAAQTAINTASDNMNSDFIQGVQRLQEMIQTQADHDRQGSSLFQ